MDMKGIQETDISREISEQAVTKLVNFGIICRVCAKESDKLIAIFGEDGTSNELAMKMNLYLPIKVLETDEMPLQCCWPCASTILAWHDLVLSCVDADRRLRSYNFIVSEKQLPEPTFTDERVLSSGVVDIIKDESIESEAETWKKNLIKDELNIVDVKSIGESDNSNLNDCVLLVTYSDPDSSLDREITLSNNDSDRDSAKGLATGARARKGIKTRRRQERKRNTLGKPYCSNLQEYLKYINFEKKSCNICHTSYNTYISLKKHLKDTHDLKEPRRRRRKEEIESLFQCFHCDKSYNRKYDMEKHVKKKHPDVKLESKQKVKKDVEHCKIETPDGVVYKCESCDQCFKCSYTLTRHQTIHTDARTHFCHICGKNFRVSSALSRHINEHHHGIKRFNCSICNKMFRTKAGRDEHLNIHNDLRPFVCDTCGKSFKQRASLHVHKMFHTNNFRFSCDVCDKKFLRKNDLKQHGLIHTGEKPFKCSVCDLAFRLKYDLKRHMGVHLKAACNKCGVEFNQERHMKKHRKDCRPEAEINVPTSS